MAKKSSAFDVAQHTLVPKHTLLSEKDKEKFLKQNNILLHNLPAIRITDAAIAALGAKVEDVVKIERNSSTAGVHHYYRRVING